MKKLLMLSLLLLHGCTSWNSDSYYQGVRDGSYSGCVYVLNAQESHFPESDMKLCRSVYNEWDDYRLRRVSNEK